MNKHLATNIFFIVALLCLFYLHVSFYWYILVIGVYLITATLGAYFIELNFFLYSYCKGKNGKPQIAITFDDGPNDHTSDILDILKEENVTAGFFCIGKNINGNESILSRIYSEGHIIGNHSFEHNNTFPIQRPTIIANEILNCSHVIERVIHKKPLLFRPPFGVTDPLVATGIKVAGVKSIGWSLRSYDTAITSPDKLLTRLSKVSNGDIVLLHDAGKFTAPVLSQFIKNVRLKGIEIVPLDQLLGIEAYEK